MRRVRSPERPAFPMKLPNTSRLHTLRMETQAAGYAMDDLRPRFAALRTRHDDGTAPRSVSAYQLFQTPPPLAARLVGLLSLLPGAHVLEPSAGLGRILDALARTPIPPSVTAVEAAPQCAAELFRQDRPAVRIIQRDFLSCTPEGLGTFDAVAMNPPFHMRSDVAHIRHALTFLRPGGTLAALCMDTRHRHEALRPLAATWETVPAGTFVAEGTHVPCVLLSIVKPYS